MRGSIKWKFWCFLIVVMGVGIYSVIFPSYKVSLAPKISQVESDFKSFESALAMYKLNAGNYPSTAQGLNALVDKPTDDPVPVRWVQIMPKIPLDPWGNSYAYRFPGSKDPTKPEFISWGPDGMNGSGDDLGTQDE